MVSWYMLGNNPSLLQKDDFSARIPHTLKHCSVISSVNLQHEESGARLILNIPAHAWLNSSLCTANDFSTHFKYSRSKNSRPNGASISASTTVSIWKRKKQSR